MRFHSAPWCNPDKHGTLLRFRRQFESAGGLHLLTLGGRFPRAGLYPVVRDGTLKLVRLQQRQPRTVCSWTASRLLRGFTGFDPQTVRHLTEGSLTVGTGPENQRGPKALQSSTLWPS